VLTLKLVLQIANILLFMKTYFCRPGSGGHEEKSSNVLFFNVYNPKYPITVVGV